MALSSRFSHLFENHIPCQYSAAEVRCKKYPYPSSADGYLDCSVAENKVVFEELDEKLSSLRIQSDDLLYPEYWYGTQVFRDAMSAFLNENLGLETTSENIVAACGASTVMELMFGALADEGECVLILAPHYINFTKILTFRNKIIPVPVHSTVSALTDPSGFFAGYLPALKSTYEKLTSEGKRVRAVLFSNPSNPMGQVAREHDLRALLDWATSLQLHVVSDEVYGMSVFGSNPEDSDKDIFVSAGKMYRPGTPESDLVHTIHSFSKDFAMSGFRIGMAVTQNYNLLLAMQKMTRFCSVSTLSQKIACHLVSDKAWLSSYFERLKGKLKRSSMQLCEGLTRLGIRHVKSEAGLFTWLHLGNQAKALLPVSSSSSSASEELTFAEENAFYQYLLQEFKLNLSPGEPFLSSEPGWFRICSAASEQVINELLSRLEKIAVDASAK